MNNDRNDANKVQALAYNDACDPGLKRRRQRREPQRTQSASRDKDRNGADEMHVLAGSGTGGRDTRRPRKSRELHTWWTKPARRAVVR